MKLLAFLLIVMVGSLQSSRPPSVKISSGSLVFNIQDTTKKPSVTLEEKLVDSMIVLFVKDTASNVTDISRIMKSGYGELFSFVHQNDLKITKVMAFYYSYEPPFI